MNRLEATFILNLIAEAFEKMPGCESEAQAVRMAIYDMGVIDELTKERNAALDTALAALKMRKEKKDATD